MYFFAAKRFKKYKNIVLIYGQVKFHHIYNHVGENLRVCICVSPSDSIYGQFLLYPSIFKHATTIWYLRFVFK